MKTGGESNENPLPDRRTGHHVAVVVVAVGLGIHQLIFPRGGAIHVRVRVDGLLGFPIGDGEEVTVGV